jgi:2'-5' RNA ligase
MHLPATRSTKRLFFCLWPNDAVRLSLADAGLAEAKACDARAMRDDTLHLTLVFLGETPLDRVADVMACAERISGEALVLAINTVDKFAKSKIIWLGMSHPPEPLFDLQASLCGHLASAGFGPYEAPFQPHVTVARGARRLPAAHGMSAIDWRANEFVLVDSDLNPPPPQRGPVYTVLKRWPLLP